MARIYQALEILKDGKGTGLYRFTVHSDEESWPAHAVGCCAQDCPGHPTKGGAELHWKQYRFDQHTKVGLEAADEQKKCQVYGDVREKVQRVKEVIDAQAEEIERLGGLIGAKDSIIVKQYEEIERLRKRGVTIAEIRSALGSAFSGVVGAHLCAILRSKGLLIEDAAQPVQENPKGGVRFDMPTDSAYRAMKKSLVDTSPVQEPPNKPSRAVGIDKAEVERFVNREFGIWAEELLPALRTLLAEAEKLHQKIHALKTMSTVEMMCENESVRQHVTEWEQRCLKAESEVLRKEITRLHEAKDLAVSAENEACAQVALGSQISESSLSAQWGRACAAAIRRRRK